MKTLMKNCDIVASGPSGFYVLKNAFCGIDNDTICYLGEKEPKESMADRVIHCVGVCAGAQYSVDDDVL